MPIFLLFVSAGVLCDGVFSLWTPYTSTPVAIQFFNGDLKKIQRFWHGNIKKVKFSEASRFSVGELTKIFFKKCRNSTKHVATLAKIKNAKKVSQYLTFMDNCQTCYLHAFVFV